MIRLLLFVLIVNCSLLAGYTTKEGSGEFPHARVYLVNPMVDGIPKEVELRVDKSGFLRGPLVHTQEEIQIEPGVFEKREIATIAVPVMPATVYYHSQKATDYLMRQGFPHFDRGAINVLLSEQSNITVTVDPSKNLITYGKSALDKHALDRDIVSAAVARLRILEMLKFEKNCGGNDKCDTLVTGISYYFSCAMSQDPVFASSVINEDISQNIREELPRHIMDNLKNRDNMLLVNLTLALAKSLWTLRDEMGDTLTNTLILRALERMKTVEGRDFLLELLLADRIYFQENHSKVIIDAFTDSQFLTLSYMLFP